MFHPPKRGAPQLLLTMGGAHVLLETTGDVEMPGRLIPHSEAATVLQQVEEWLAKARAALQAEG